MFSTAKKCCTQFCLFSVKSSVVSQKFASHFYFFIFLLIPFHVRSGYKSGSGNENGFRFRKDIRFRFRNTANGSVPDPPDPHVFRPPGSGSTSQRYGSGSGSGSFYRHAKIVRKPLIPTIL
jgi:hypothetical protein